MVEIVVIGGGGHAKVVINVLKKSGYEIRGYTDSEDRGPILGVPYLGNDGHLAALTAARAPCGAVVGVGKIDASARRLELQDRVETLGFQFPAICSPQAIIGESAVFGAGTVVLDGVVVNSGATTGRACILNSNSTIEHDCVIGDNVHIAPGATLSGGVSIGDHCLVGAGAVVIQSIRVCTGTLVGAGATVVRDITTPGTYAGTPAKRIR